jgi:N-acetylmuramoyl-L-alanine amidase
MRSIVCLILFIILLSPYPLYGESQPLKLRIGYHEDFLRIVLEGAKPLIDEAIVNQKARDILVTFPDREVSIEHEGEIRIPYRKVGQSAILFSPGNFRGLKVFTLSRPDRLVIDVYLEDVRRRAKKEPLRLKTVIIDPGHGGYESGIARGQYREKNVVLDIARRLGALIGRESTRAVLTRQSDLYMPLSERVRVANSKKANVFISLHVGNHENMVIYLPVITESTPEYIRGYLINRGQMDYLGKTSTLASAIRKAIASDFGEDMVVIEPLPYSMLSRIEAAAVIIELPSFEDVNYTRGLKSQIAQTIYRGLYIYEEDSSN